MAAAQGAAQTDAGSEENYNIFRWYKSASGRYTQADPIGLNGGMNLYRYAGDDPVAYADPLGLVTWTQNAPVYHGAKWDDVSHACGDWTAHGCTAPFVSSKCVCGCDAGSYRAKVSLSMNMNVWARNDDPHASLSQILYEEEKHVRDYKVRFRWAIQRGERLEAQKFLNKPDCDTACKAFYKATNDDFMSGNGWVHQHNPHPF